MSDDASRSPQLGNQPEDNTPGLSSEWALHREHEARELRSLPESEASVPDPIHPFIIGIREHTFEIEVFDDGLTPEPLRQRIEAQGWFVEQVMFEGSSIERRVRFRGRIPAEHFVMPQIGDFARELGNALGVLNVTLHTHWDVPELHYFDRYEASAPPEPLSDSDFGDDEDFDDDGDYDIYDDYDY